MGLATIRRRYKSQNDVVERKEETKDYSEMTVEELKYELQSKNIDFNSKAKKQELIELLEGDKHVTG